MSNHKTNLLKGAALLGIGQFVSYGSSFIRNLILARILTKADFGMAAAMSMTITLLEFVSRMSFGKQIIQSSEGDESNFQAVAHSVQISCGFFSAFIVLIGAFPMAIAFGVPKLTWAFALLSIVPIFRGFIHLDLARMQRSFNYAPAVFSDAIPQVFTAIFAWPIAKWMGDFRSILWIMLGKEFLTVCLSHFFSKRSFRCSWDSAIVKNMLKFGWPLLLNGIVLFASQQGDQMIIGSTFSLSDLGVYSIAFILPSIAFSIFAQIGSSLMLPSLSKHQSDITIFRLNYQRCLEMSVLATLLVIGPLVIAGNDIVKLIYGSKYSDVGSLVSIFGIMMALRFFRWAPAVAAMSMADTMNQLFGNIARSLSLAIAIILVTFGVRNMAAVASCGIIGEFISIIISIMRVKKRQKIEITIHLKSGLFLVCWLTSALFVHIWLRSINIVWTEIFATISFIIIWIIISIYLFPELLLKNLRRFNLINSSL